MFHNKIYKLMVAFIFLVLRLPVLKPQAKNNTPFMN